MRLTRLLSTKYLKLAIIACLFLSSAHAAGNPLGNSQPLDMSLFIPNAPKWIADSMKTLKENHIMEWTSKAASLLIGILFVWSIISTWANRKTGALIRQFVISMIALGLIADMSNPSGVLAPAYQAPMKLWQKAYTASNDAIAEPLQNTVVKDTRDLAISVHNFFLNSTMGMTAILNLDTQRSAIFDNTKNGDTASNTYLGESQLQNLKDVAKEQTDAMKKATGIFQIGYVLLLSFFMAYSGIIYLSAMTVILGLLLMPLAIAFWTANNSMPLQFIAVGMLGSVLTVVITPPIMMLAASTALHQPTVYIKSMIDVNNEDAKTVINDYINRTSSCSSDTFVIGGAKQDACAVGSNTIPMVAEAGRVTFKVLMGMCVMIITLMVSLGVGVAIMRQVPSLVQSAFGSGFGAGSAGAAAGGSASNAMRTLSNIGGGALGAGRALARGAPKALQSGANMAMAPVNAARNAPASAKLALTQTKMGLATAQGAVNSAAGKASAAGAALQKGAASIGNAGANKQMAGIKASQFNASEQAKASASSARREAQMSANASGGAGMMGSTSNSGKGASSPSAAPGAASMNKANANAGTSTGSAGNSGNAYGATVSAGSAPAGKSNGANARSGSGGQVAVEKQYQPKSTSQGEQLKQMKKNGQLAQSDSNKAIDQRLAAGQAKRNERGQEINQRKEALSKEIDKLKGNKPAAQAQNTQSRGRRSA